MYIRICIHILTCYTHTHTHTHTHTQVYQQRAVSPTFVQQAPIQYQYQAPILKKYSIVTGPSKYTRALTFEIVEYEYVDLDY
jgi:hypothetical protein